MDCLDFVDPDHLESENPEDVVVGDPENDLDFKNLICRLCNKKFLNKSLLSDHHNFHSGKRPYKCDKCPKTFGYRRYKQRHMKIHKNIKKMVCKFCSLRSFKNSANLQKHEITCMKRFPFECQICHQRFPIVSKLQKHEKKHPKSERLLFKQTKKGGKNGQVLSSKLSKSDLKMKIKLEPGIKTEPAEELIKEMDVQKVKAKMIDKPYSCDACDKKFSVRGKVTEHYNIVHLGIKKYVCKICDKRYSKSSGLKEHMTSHTGEKPFKCNFCHKAFGRSQSLYSHEATHSRNKPFQCHDCPKSFRTSYNLKIHSDIHAKVKPFKCQCCEKKFPSKLKLKAHEEYMIRNS